MKALKALPVVLAILTVSFIGLTATAQAKDCAIVKKAAECKAGCSWDKKKAICAKNPKSVTKSTKPTKRKNAATSITNATGTAAATSASQGKAVKPAKDPVKKATSTKPKKDAPTPAKGKTPATKPEPAKKNQPAEESAPAPSEQKNPADEESAAEEDF